MDNDIVDISDSQPPIIDGEIVNEETDDFLNLESLIKTYVAKLDKLQKEIHE